MSIKHLSKFRRGHSPAGALNNGGVYFSDFRPLSGYISLTVQDNAIVTMEGE